MGLKIAESNNQVNKKRYLIISIVSNLLVLGSFKYFTFFYNSGVYFANNIGDYQFNILSQVIIPVGLSFYTFQSLAYTIDVYRGEIIPEKNLGKFALFISFFPQLVAGPVERFNVLMPQLKSTPRFNLQILFPATRIIVWGFFKKLVIADRLAEIVDPIFANVNSYSGSTLLFAGFLFTVQLYTDFSGYTDIATGTARLFGVNLSLNWKRPLLSTSLLQYWKRHHITMTNWFRNYLYVPLGGNRVTRSRWIYNIFIVFLISGLWHGANWTFVIWGAMHGTLYIIELLIKNRFPTIKAPFGLGHIYLLLFQSIAFIAFRSQSVTDIGIIYQKIFTNFNIEFLSQELVNVCNVFPLFLNLGFVLFLFLKEIQEEKGLINSKKKFYINYLRPLFYISLFIGIFLWGNFNSNQFIYFRF